MFGRALRSKMFIKSQQCSVPVSEINSLVSEKKYNYIFSHSIIVSCLNGLIQACSK